MTVTYEITEDGIETFSEVGKVDLVKEDENTYEVNMPISVRIKAPFWEAIRLGWLAWRGRLVYSSTVSTDLVISGCFPPSGLNGTCSAFRE